MTPEQASSNEHSAGSPGSKKSRVVTRRTALNLFFRQAVAAVQNSRAKMVSAIATAATKPKPGTKPNGGSAENE